MDDNKNTEERSWNDHYRDGKSVLNYPDENLVRMLTAHLKDKKPALMQAVDLGCGTGRHIKLLKENGIVHVSGIDLSINALEICRNLYGIHVVKSDIRTLPLSDKRFDIIVAWGSLHYSDKGSLSPMLQEIYRILREGGRLFGTLRNDRDNHLKQGIHLGNNVWKTDSLDLTGNMVSFYNEQELQKELSLFNRVSYGIMERSVLGDLTTIISHWYFWAEK